MLSEAFRNLSRYPLLAVIPIVIDGLSVLLGTGMHGFHGSPHVTLKLALQMGLPSIGAVTEQGFMPGSVQINAAGFNAGSLLGVLVYLVLFLALQAFLQGGYVGSLFAAVGGRRPTLEGFAMYGSRFFSRFLLLNLLVIAFTFIVGGLLTVILKMPGVVVMMFIFLLLRVLFLYLEFTLVADDCSLSEAFSRSREAFHRRTSDTLTLVIVALVINVIAGLLVNALWLPLFFFALLVIYDVVGAGLQVAFMRDFRRIRGQL